MSKWILDKYDPSGWEKIFHCDNCQYKLHLMSAKLIPVIAETCPRCRSKMTGTEFNGALDAMEEIYGN